MVTTDKTSRNPFCLNNSTRARESVRTEFLVMDLISLFRHYKITSHERHVVSYHWQFDCLLNSLLCCHKKHKALTASRDPDNKVHGASMGPAWVLSAPGGPHVGPMNLAIWGGRLTSGFPHRGPVMPQAFPCHGVFMLQNFHY